MTVSKDSFNQDHINDIRNYILSKKETIAIAESVTSGLLQTAFALAPDASKFYQGGITAYNLGQKYKHLGVEPIHAENCDCVSKKVAGQMANNVCDLFKSDWGIGVTGYAVPVPESWQKLYAFYAIAHHHKIILNGMVAAKKQESSQAQLLYVNAVLKEFRQYLLAKK